MHGVSSANVWAAAAHVCRYLLSGHNTGEAVGEADAFTEEALMVRSYGNITLGMKNTISVYSWQGCKKGVWVTTLQLIQKCSVSSLRHQLFSFPLLIYTPDSRRPSGVHDWERRHAHQSNSPSQRRQSACNLYFFYELTVYIRDTKYICVSSDKEVEEDCLFLLYVRFGLLCHNFP